MYGREERESMYASGNLSSSTANEAVPSEPLVR